MNKLNELDKYIEQIKGYKSKNPQLTELELVRYVYIDLGKRLSFDLEFIPFGNYKNREKIYKKSSGDENLNKCMETNTIICKSAAYIMEKQPFSRFKEAAWSCRRNSF